MTELDLYEQWVLEHRKFKLYELRLTRFVFEYRKYNTLLRKKGYKIDCEINGKEPIENTYTVVPPAQYEIEENGQMRMVV